MTTATQEKTVDENQAITTEATEAQAEVAKVEESGQTEEQKAQEEASALLAGYAKVPGQREEIKDEAPPHEAMPIKIAGLTEEEIIAKLNKAEELEQTVTQRLQKVFNHIGNLQQELKAIPRDASNAQVRAVTKDSLKKIREMGFDELAEALEQDLGALTVAQPAQSVDVGGTVKTVLTETALSDLDDVHPNWRKTSQLDQNGKFTDPDFSSWYALQTADMQERIMSSNSVPFLIRVFDRFDDWKRDKSSRQEQQRTNSEDRIRNAVTPTSGKSAAATPTRLPDEEGLWIGYRGRKP